MKYSALFSTDWSECLSPNGPFDVLSYVYPEKKDALGAIFMEYTSNRITLSRAMSQIRDLIKEPLDSWQMDDYLKLHFRTYRGVFDLIRWCGENSILFMVNTTNMLGYFQRALFWGLIPTFPVLSANPMISFRQEETDPGIIFNLLEIEDKPGHTERAARKFGIPFDRVFVMGDSGGDGPHFKWGFEKGAVCIGSMTKPSLQAFLDKEGIELAYRFGVDYSGGMKKDPEREMLVDFMELADFIKSRL